MARNPAPASSSSQVAKESTEWPVLYPAYRWRRRQRTSHQAVRGLGARRWSHWGSCCNEWHRDGHLASSRIGVARLSGSWSAPHSAHGERISGRSLDKWANGATVGMASDAQCVRTRWAQWVANRHCGLAGTLPRWVSHLAGLASDLAHRHVAGGLELLRRRSSSRRWRGGTSSPPLPAWPNRNGQVKPLGPDHPLGHRGWSWLFGD